MTRPDERSTLLGAVGRELRWRPWTRRRLLRELEQHLDDSIADLQASGLSADAATRRGLDRLGDADTIIAALRTSRRPQRLRSPAWVAVGAMSLVTAWAAELPPASGAKATARAPRIQQVLVHRKSRKRLVCSAALRACLAHRP